MAGKPNPYDAMTSVICTRMFTDEEKVEIQQAIQKNRGPLIALPDNLAIRSLDLAADTGRDPDGLTPHGHQYMQSEFDRQARREKGIEELLLFLEREARESAKTLRPMNLHFNASGSTTLSKGLRWWAARKLLKLAAWILGPRARFSEGSRFLGYSHIWIPTRLVDPLFDDRKVTEV